MKRKCELHFRTKGNVSWRGTRVPVRLSWLQFLANNKVIEFKGSDNSLAVAPMISYHVFEDGYR